MDIIELMKPHFPKLIAILIIFALLVAAFPVFSGQAEGQYFNENLKGFWIPSEYQTIYNYLQSHTGDVLILPAISTYFQTSWGYQGSNHFYDTFFSPSTVYTLDSFGGGYASAESMATYYNLTEPKLIPSTNQMQLQYYVNTSSITVSNGRYILANNDVQLFPFNKTENIKISIPFSKPINVSNFSDVEIRISIGNSSFAQNLLSQQQLWIGLSSPLTTGWYIIGLGGNSYALPVGNGTYDFFLMVGEPSQLWPSNSYTPSNVTGIVLQFPNNGSQTSLSLPKVFGTKGYSVDPTWFVLIANYKIQYLLLDKSIASGNLTSVQFDYNLVVALQAENDIKPIFNGTYLELLQID